MRDALQAAGYTILNADQLKTWMNDRIADKKLSVVVFCLDVAPDTVCETMDANCTLRKYLNAGGKIVWYADWPFYYQGHADGSMDTWGGGGASAVLGFDASSGPNETYEQVTFTAAGINWGLRQAWQSRRPTSATITSNLTVLATISSGSAAAWVKHYVAGDKYRGFVRLYDTAGTPSPEDVMRLAEFMGKKASTPNPPDGALNVLQPLLSWAAGVTAAYHDLYFGTNPTPGAAEFIVRQAANQTVYWHQPGLVPGTTYYWRVDEVEADGTTIHKGDVWTFTAPAMTAWRPKPADGAENVFTDVKVGWNAGWGAFMHHVYFGESYDDVDNGIAGTDKGITTETTYAITGLRAESTYYWRVDEFDGTTWLKGPVWSFSTLPGGTGRIIRQWWSNIGAGTAIGDLTGNANYPDNPTGWEFVDLFEGPVDVADNYGSRLRGWLFPPATGDYTFWIATDDAGQLWLSTDADPANKQLIASVSGWVPSRDFDNTGGGAGGPEQKSAAISLEAGKAYYIEAMMKEGGGGDNIAVAWQGGPITTRQVITADYVGPTGSIPLKAYGPSPSNGATDVIETVTLGWSAGEKAAQHDVFFGTDRTAVANATTATTGIYRGRQNLAATTYVPTESPLAWDTTYYWRVDEINTADPEGPWKGNVWSFTTANFILVEDFERYNDLCDRIFYTWTDGWGYSADPTCGVTAYGGNGTGSTVGNLAAPFAEQTIVHSGGQSMPFEYNNTGTGGKARYSEAQRQWASPQNWARNNVKALTLWFYGDVANVPETLYVAVEDSTGQVRVANHPDREALQIAAWQEWNVPLTQFAGVNLASVKKMYIGVGNRASPTAGGSGKIYIDDIRVYPSRCVFLMAKPAADIAEPYNCKVDYEDLRILAYGWLFETQLHNWQEHAAYWDIRYRTNWASEADSVAVRDGLAAAGYTILNADQLKTWMNARITDKKLSVVVFCRDNAPDTVVESVDATCTLRKYLDAGGKIVFYADIPFWDIAHVDGTWDNPQTAGASAILGFDNTVVLWDSNAQVALTTDGIAWGLTQTWASVRPIATTDVTVLATDAAGNAAAWVRHYLPGDTYRGFVRLWDRTGHPPVGDIIRAAESRLAADLHQDGLVDFKDFAVFADAWLDEVFWP
jgi:hypothetical protein